MTQDQELTTPEMQQSLQDVDSMDTGPTNSAENTPSSTKEVQTSSESVKDKSQTNNQTANKENKQDDDGKKDEGNDRKNNSIDTSKEIVHGFGLVLSVDVLQKPMDFYQPPLEDPFSIIQEFPLERRLSEEFYIDIFRQNDIEDYFINNSNRSWEWLRRGNFLQ